MEATEPQKHCSIFGGCTWVWNAQFYVLGVIVDAQRNSSKFLSKLR